MSSRLPLERPSPQRPYGQGIPGQPNCLWSTGQDVIQVPNTHDRHQGPRTLTRQNRVNPLEKRCEDLKLLRYLIRASLRHEKHRSFLFSRLDLLKRTDPDEAVRNVEYIL